MCDVILQPAPGALQAARRTARLFLPLFLSLCSNSLVAPNILHPPTTDMFFFFFFPPSHTKKYPWVCVRASCWGKHISGNRDVGGWYYLNSVRIRSVLSFFLYVFLYRSMNFCLSPAVSISPLLSSPLSLFRRVFVALRVFVDGKNPEEDMNGQSEGLWGGKKRCFFQMFVHWSILLRPDFFYCQEWSLLIHWRAVRFIYKGCGQVCWKNSHSFRSVR